MLKVYQRDVAGSLTFRLPSVSLTMTVPNPSIRRLSNMGIRLMDTTGSSTVTLVMARMGVTYSLFLIFAFEFVNSTKRMWWSRKKCKNHFVRSEHHSW